MEANGIAAFDLQGNFIGLEKLADQLRSGLGGLTEEQRLSALATIFGQDAIRASNVLYEKGSEKVKEYTDAVSNKGTAEAKAAELTNSLQGSVDKLTGAWEAFVTSLIDRRSIPGEVFGGILAGVTAILNKFAGVTNPIEDEI
jgi:TP901 family phage tail tape measure protein